jgi:hypothetical protein
MFLLCMKRLWIILIVLYFIVSLSAQSVFAWYEETHMVILKAAGYNKWYNAAGPDITKIKADRIESYNHFFNNNGFAEVTPEMVLKQAERYNDPGDSEGHLYGAIIASVREYKDILGMTTQYPGHYFVFCAHYIGDLSNPFHNVPYDDFNKAHHAYNDGVIEDEAFKNIKKIEQSMHPVNLRADHFEADLAGEISRIANGARLLGYTLKKENRDLTKEEAYAQLGQSASLLKAVWKYFGKVHQNK